MAIPSNYEPLLDASSGENVGAVMDFEQPTFTDAVAVDKGLTLAQVRELNTVQPAGPETYVVPFDDFVGYAPYVRDIPRDSSDRGMIAVNAAPSPMTQGEQQTVNKSSSNLPDEELPAGYSWTISGLSWQGVAVGALILGAAWFIMRKGTS